MTDVLTKGNLVTILRHTLALGALRCSKCRLVLLHCKHSLHNQILHTACSEDCWRAFLDVVDPKILSDARCEGQTPARHAVPAALVEAASAARPVRSCWHRCLTYIHAQHSLRMQPCPPPASWAHSGRPSSTYACHICSMQEHLLPGRLSAVRRHAASMDWAA